MTDYYKDMELVYKPAVQKLRDDMKRIRDLAREIVKLAESHDYPELPKQDIGTAYLHKPEKPGQKIWENLSEDEQMNHFHGGCEECDRMLDPYEQVDLEDQRKGD